MALGDGDGVNSNWRADPSGRARPLQNGNQGASRMPSMYGGEGATPVVGRGVPLPASEVRAAGFGLFDPRVSTEEFSARFASYRAARSDSVAGVMSIVESVMAGTMMQSCASSWSRIGE